MWTEKRKGAGESGMDTSEGGTQKFTWASEGIRPVIFCPRSHSGVTLVLLRNTHLHFSCSQKETKPDRCGNSPLGPSEPSTFVPEVKTTGEFCSHKMRLFCFQSLLFPDQLEWVWFQIAFTELLYIVNAGLIWAWSCPLVVTSWSSHQHGLCFSTSLYQENTTTLRSGEMTQCKEHSLLLQRTSVQFPAPTQQLTHVCNSSPTGFHPFFWPPQMLGTCMPQTAGKTVIHMKYTN